MKTLSDTYKLKEGSVKEPDTYLKADISKYTITRGEQVVSCYSMSSDSYLKQAIKVVEDELALVNQSLKRKAPSPMASGYRPELDSSPYLNPSRASYFMSLGILRWTIWFYREEIPAQTQSLGNGA